MLSLIDKFILNFILEKIKSLTNTLVWVAIVCQPVVFFFFWRESGAPLKKKTKNSEFSSQNHTCFSLQQTITPHMQQKWTLSTSYFISQIINKMNTQGLRLNKTSNFLPQQRHLEVKLACFLPARPYSSVPNALIHDKVQAILPHSVQMSTVRKANNMLILLWEQFWTYRPPEEGIPRDPRKYYLRTTSLSWPL